MKILVADDDPATRELMTIQLRHLGHEVVAVEDGARALAALAAEDAPRLALVDWSMPQRNGLEVCRQVRRAASQRYTYIALLTGRSQPEDLIAGLEAGADDFLTKPISAAELRARVRSAERVLSLEADLVRWRAYLEAVLMNIESAVVLLDGSGKVAFSNDALAELVGISPDEAIGLDRGELLDRCADLFDDAPTVRTAMAGAAQAGAVGAQTIAIQRPLPRLIRWTSKAVPLPGGDGRLDIWRDITREAELTEALKHQAERDPLTGLFNRRGAAVALNRELARAAREGKPLAVLLVDVDHFKRVNDTRGHDVGDAVIRHVAATITGALRPYDIVARWGGEEFLVAAPGAGPAEALDIGERMRAAIERAAPRRCPR